MTVPGAQSLQAPPETRLLNTDGTCHLVMKRTCLDSYIGHIKIETEMFILELKNYPIMDSDTVHHLQTDHRHKRKLAR
jgi:hypothetical protein